jgi:hypothetical protein
MISNMFQKLYSFETTVFPLGIVMRFVPHILKVGPDKKNKIITLRSRQASYLKAIEDPDRPMSAISWEILALDKELNGIGSLREQLMAIKSKIRTNEKIFLSVDTSFFRSNEVIFTFYQGMKQKQETLFQIWFRFLYTTSKMSTYILSFNLKHWKEPYKHSGTKKMER